MWPFSSKPKESEQPAGTMAMSTPPVTLNPVPKSAQSVARNFSRIGRLRLRLRDTSIDQERRASMEGELMRRIGALKQAKYDVPDDPDDCLAMANNVLMEAAHGGE